MCVLHLENQERETAAAAAARRPAEQVVVYSMPMVPPAAVVLLDSVTEVTAALGYRAGEFLRSAIEPRLS
jgi:hypothetical protein